MEVRTKRGGAFGTPEESVTAAKQRRLAATAYHYLEEHGLDVPFRIDLVAIVMSTRGVVEAGHAPGERRHRRGRVGRVSR